MALIKFQQISKTTQRQLQNLNKNHDKTDMEI